MEKDMVFNMENLFYTTISQIHEYHKIQKELKWYEKINPVIIYKLNLVKEKILKQVTTIIINYGDIDKRFLFNFQSMYLANIETMNMEPIIVVSKYRDEQRGDIFYQMCFQHRYSIDIISNNITIGDSLLGFRFHCEEYIPENTDTVANIMENIRECIILYFKEFINKK